MTRKTRTAVATPDRTPGPVCPECGSGRHQKLGFVVRKRKDVQRYRCLDCKRTYTPLDNTNSEKE